MDLNCDMGESFGRYPLGDDAAVMPFITSANIACGLHAGDPLVMAATVRIAKEHGVAVGAHPGWPDLQGFGRREMALSPEEAGAFVLYQIGSLSAIARTQGVELRHVKPHGALYNQAVKDRPLAEAIARAVKAFDPQLIFVGLAGSAMLDAAREIGLHIANEAFPDRRYNPDGTLLSRKQPDAVLSSPEEVAAQAVSLSKDGIDFGGKRVAVDTLCLHGDNPHAAENARLVSEALFSAGIEVEAMGR
jgi:UPF0271 protein